MHSQANQPFYRRSAPDKNMHSQANQLFYRRSAPDKI
jgi:hypothetical protein